MPDHFCIVSDHTKLKFSSHRHNVSPAADSYNWPWYVPSEYKITGGPCMHWPFSVHFSKMADQNINQAVHIQAYKWPISRHDKISGQMRMYFSSIF